VGDPTIADVHGLEHHRLALCAVVADPVGADHEAVVADRDELGRACALVARL
jgi:hypothetical protein